MARFLYIILLVLLHFSATAQATKRIVKEFPRSKQISEHYTVLKSNKAIKHGDYVAYFSFNKEQAQFIKQGRDSLEHYIKQRGTYINGKKHGEWLEYSQPGILYSRGTYAQGQKVGIWATSKANGEVVARYDYTTRQKLVPEIKIALNYPRKVREGNIQGIVVIQYQLQTDCSITDLKVIKSLTAECDQEATRTVLKYYKYLQEYGPPLGCEAKTDIFKVRFQLE